MSIRNSVLNEGRLLSIVETPFSKYVVLDHKHPTYNESGSELDYMLEKTSGTLCLGNKEDTDVVNIKKLLLEKPDFQINADISHNQLYSIPSGTIEQLLSEDMITKLAKKYYAEDVQSFQKRNGDINSLPALEIYKKTTSEVVPQIIFNQLVQNSAKHHLQFTHERFPNFVEFNDNWLLIVDTAHRSNNGYAPAGAFLYQMKPAEKQENNQNNFFPSHKVILSNMERCQFKFLSNYETAQVLDKNSNLLRKDKEVIKLNSQGSPAILYK